MCGGFPGCCCELEFDDHFVDADIHGRWKRYQANIGTSKAPLPNTIYSQAGSIISRDYWDDLVEINDIGACWIYPQFTTWKQTFEFTYGTGYVPRGTASGTDEEADGDITGIFIRAEWFLNLRSSGIGSAPGGYNFQAYPSGTGGVGGISQVYDTATGLPLIADSGDVVQFEISKTAADSYTFKLFVNGVQPSFAAPLGLVQSTFQLTGRTSAINSTNRKYFSSWNRTIDRMRIFIEDTTVEAPPPP